MNASSLFVDKEVAQRRVAESNVARKTAKTASVEYHGSVEANKKRAARKQQMHLDTYESVAGGAKIDSFATLLREPLPVDVVSSEQTDAYRLGDYCRTALAVLSKVLDTLTSAPFDGVDGEVNQLKTLRSMWGDHLRNHFYTLWLPPPNSGGRTASFSLAIQLWLLVAHANCILQTLDRAMLANVRTFCVQSSVYLSRNALVVDPAPVFTYTLCSLLTALEHFVARLDTLDAFHVDYLRYAAALEHSVARYICLSGPSTTFNAPLWCNRSGAKQYRTNDRFLTRTMILMRVVYMYVENYIAVGAGIGDDAPPSPHAPRPYAGAIRVPLAAVRLQPWYAPTHATQGMLVFLYRYASDLRDQVYRSELGNFLLQLLMRPCDMDVYRSATRDNNASISLARVYAFDHLDHAANRYRTQVHFNRAPEAYVAEAMHWADGAADGTRSAALGTQHFVRQLALLYIFHQYLLGKFGFDFKGRCMLFQRDPALSNTLPRAHQLPYPVIVQQFGRFSILVPRHTARGREWPERLYECDSVIDALVAWCVHLMHMSGGRIDKQISLARFMDDVLGPSVRAAADAFSIKKPTT